MNTGISELLIVLVIVVLIFGVGRISKIANELGQSIHAFKEGLKGNEGSSDADGNASPEDDISST